jgi:hypothetical protein
MPRSALPSLLCLLAIAGPAAAGDSTAAVASADTGGDALPASAARWSASGEPSEGGYRLSLARRGLDVGLDFQRRLAAVRTLDGRFDSAAPPGTMLPAVSFGLRSVSAGAPANSLVDRTLGSDSDARLISRVGVEFKPAQAPVFLNQGLGFRLGGDDKLTMRLRKGSLGIYLKRNF